MNSNLKLLFLVFLFFSSCFFSFSQNVNTGKVILVEKQNGKRLELYAKNTDSIGYVVFLRVTTQDYRRSSNRPVLKPIEPNSETHLLTLIKLAGTAGDYEHQFIVNEVSANLQFRKDDEDLQINFDDALKTANITIYTSNNCSFCEETKSLFNENKIAFKERHLEKDKVILTKTLKASGKSIENIDKEIFIIQIESDIYRGLATKKQLLEVLQKHIE
ncbi:glutaredoxin domain-containing protein [Algibacter sp. R77976]|uniref:glutaredoxin domain-containing protein n=1 Tax=Algibacter sp. R77976 TaxID=3093873 RepID=UPI0037C692F4